MKDEPLFDVPETAPVKQPESQRRMALAKKAKAKWSKYRPKNRIPCDSCIAILHEANGVGPYAGAAMWKLTIDDTVLLLCYEHAKTHPLRGD
jgi:hypothetical protein